VPPYANWYQLQGNKQLASCDDESLDLCFHSSTEDRLCGIVVRVAGYTTEMYCDSCEVRTEYIYEYVM
jgi:hypothetical protein